jgi:hypothetical protein
VQVPLGHYILSRISAYPRYKAKYTYKNGKQTNNHPPVSDTTKHMVESDEKTGLTAFKYRVLCILGR